VVAARSWQLLREIALLACPALLQLLIVYFHWGAGLERLLGFVALAGFVLLAIWRRGRAPSLFDGRARWLLAIAALALLSQHVRLFARDIAAGGECLTDMGRPSICAGEWLRRGMNPWAECAERPRRRQRPKPPQDTWAWCLAVDNCVDRKAGGTYKDWTHHGPHYDFMDGYKYGPLTALTYLPFVHELRERGLYAVNFAFWLAQVALVWLLARAAYRTLPGAPWRALVVLLLPVAIPNQELFPKTHIEALGERWELIPPEIETFVLELTRRCAMDILPVAWMLSATLLAAYGRSRLAGVLLGLSLAAKQLPGLLLCVLLPGLRGVRPLALTVSTAITTALCYLPFFAWAPREMIANLILFSALRPTNSSSVRAYLPASWDWLVSALQLLAVGLIALFFYRRTQRSLVVLLQAAALGTIAFVALNKVVHGNYLLWLQPWLALLIAGVPFAPRSER
jgi:hypothetical protein